MLRESHYHNVRNAVDLAINRVLTKGPDDVFKPPMFSNTIEESILAKKGDEFRRDALKIGIKFLNVADLRTDKIGLARRGLVAKDENSFRQVSWLDPFDAVRYLAVTYLLFNKIESVRIPKEHNKVHSHRLSTRPNEIFDSNFGYDSFRAASSQLSRERVGKWKVVTDIANFFDRIGNHSLENKLKEIGCDDCYVSLVREILLFWTEGRRSFGLPVGSDASRILSEVSLIDVDQKLQERGVVFVRYVDDFRLFAETRAEALKAVETLTNLLADEGLSLNSRKTDIFQIIEPEEISDYTNKLAGGEHEKIDLEERIEIRKAIRVSGRSSISRFYREPGKEALRKILSLDKESLINEFKVSQGSDIEQRLKLLVKYFVYAEQDTSILETLIEKKITAIFYIVDALIKEADRFSSEKLVEIKRAVYNSVDWLNCAYPYQVPILRLSGHRSFKEPQFVRSIVDDYTQMTSSILFFREAISLGYQSLDRSRVRRLATEVFPNVPDLIQRTIFSAVKNHDGLTDDEKRPLLKNMEQQVDDWFIARL